jgi:DNA-directed RNA polymerase specialized sigma24 family protein
LTIQKLTQRKSKDGTLYSRPPDVEAAIAAALPLQVEEVLARAGVTRTDDPRYLRSEVLVHLIREAMRAEKESAYNALLRALLERCMKILRSGISDSSIFDAEAVREEVISKVGLLFAQEHRRTNAKLDFYEIRFNNAFRKFYITGMRAELKELRNRVLPASRDADDDLPEEDVFAEHEIKNRTFASPEALLELKEFAELVDQLPEKEREAFVLRNIIGLEVESTNPEEETVATRCGVTGRAIRKRLNKAVKRIPRLQEYAK